MSDSAMLVWRESTRSYEGLEAETPFGAFYRIENLDPPGWDAYLDAPDTLKDGAGVLLAEHLPDEAAARAACEADYREKVEAMAAAILSDPVAVHTNMLAGRIATPTVAQFVHVVGDARMRAAGWVPAGEVERLRAELRRIDRLTQQAGKMPAEVIVNRAQDFVRAALAPTTKGGADA